MNSLLHTSRTTLRASSSRICRQTRTVASAAASEFGSSSSSSKAKPKPKVTEAIPLSSCIENTTLTGLNYLKGQAPVLALKDEDYPPWLWNLLKPKVYPDDGPGGKGEKMRLRAANKKRIKEQNFLKTQ